MDKYMPKRLIYIAVALIAMAMAIVSCQEHDEWGKGNESVPDGFVKLEFKVSAPAAEEVKSRSVDPDGGGIQNMTLFCFDRYGLFITTTTTTITPDTPNPNDLASYTRGKITAVVPKHTRVIHFVANQRLADFHDSDYQNQSESEVMRNMEGSSTRMIYWARFACKNDTEANLNKSIDVQLAEYLTTVEGINGAEAQSIQMIRNHAKISIKNPHINTGVPADDELYNNFIEVSEWYIVNTNQFGTVAPYHPDQGFNFTWPGDTNFVTLPQSGKKITNPMEMMMKASTPEGQIVHTQGMYVFETENTAEDPVSIIIKGKNKSADKEQYFRVMVINDNGNQIMIRRNYNYILNIQGELQYGQDNLSDAQEAPATNNVWVAISDDVSEVQDETYVLSVDGTAHVLDESYTLGGINDGKYQLNYTLRRLDGQPLNNGEPSKVEISWLPGNNVAQSSVEHDPQPSTLTINGTPVPVIQGHLNLKLFPITEGEKQEGTIVIKFGRLSRKIKVITIKKQNFEPAWVSNHIDADVTETHRPPVTLMFTIPATTPKELFPMDVMISTQDLDIRPSTGMKLDVIYKGQEGFGTDHYGTGYKYVFRADSSGIQRVYFESIVDQFPTTEGEEVKRELTIEAPHFNSLTCAYVFAKDENHISVSGANMYSFVSPEFEDGYAKGDEIKYILVPRKRYAHIEFTMNLDYGTPDLAGTAQDEFLLYGQRLKSYAHVDRGATEPHMETQAPEGTPGGDPLPGQPGLEKLELLFHPFQSQDWMVENNPQGGRMLMFKPKTPAHTSHTVHLYTENPVSDQVVRIASNRHDMPSVLDPTSLYSGNVYRSTTFELATFNPFRFAASLRRPNDNKEWYENFNQQSTATVAGESNNNNNKEEITEAEWSYKLNEPVEIEFDVTSFWNRIDGQVTDVNPFGEEFEIYIDAPMLEIDNDRLAAYNLNADKLKEIADGRFVYTVEADRETERQYGFSGLAVKRDATKDKNNNNVGNNVSQTGERKRLPFRTKSITSAGDIVISSNKEKVDFFSKTFRISNAPMTGTIHYAESESMSADGVVSHTGKKVIPATGFISFSMTANNERIGVITLESNANGTTQYTLHLRGESEYQYKWDSEIKLQYTAVDTNGNYVSYVLDKYWRETEENGEKVYEPTELTLNHLFEIQKELVLVKQTN